MDVIIQSERRLWIEYTLSADRYPRSEYNAMNASLSSTPCDGSD